MSYMGKLCLKWVPFVSKYYIKGKGVGAQGRVSLYETFLSTPHPPLPCPMQCFDELGFFVFEAQDLEF